MAEQTAVNLVDIGTSADDDGFFNGITAADNSKVLSKDFFLAISRCGWYNCMHATVDEVEVGASGATGATGAT